MKLFLTLRPCLALGDKIAAVPDLAASLGHVRIGHLHAFKKGFDAEGPLLARVLAIDDPERPSFLRELRFTEAELASSARLEVRPRVTVGQSPAAAEATRGAYEAQPLVQGGAAWPVRLPQRIFLGKPVPPRTVAHVDHWTGEYVMDAEAAHALRQSGLGGWRLSPVLRPKDGQPQAGFGEHLWTTGLLAPALRTWSAFGATPSGPAQPPRRFGLLAYSATALDAPDFARTAEPWDNWGIPAWTVSQAVRRWYLAQGLRGWTFWPVLVQNSAGLEQHEGIWRRTLEAVRGAGGEVLA